MAQVISYSLLAQHLGVVNLGKQLYNKNNLASLMTSLQSFCFLHDKKNSKNCTTNN